MEGDGWVTATAGDSRSTERRYAVTEGRRARAGGVDRLPHPGGGDALRPRGEDARGVVRRPGAAARPPRRPRRGAPHPAGPLRAARARAVPRHRRPSPATTSTPGWSCAAASSRSSSGSSGSPSTSRPIGRRPVNDYPHLLEPITIGDLTLRNRVVMGSMHTGLEDYAWDIPKLAAYFAERARGGVGPDRHRRLRAHQARLAQAVRERADHPAAGRAAPAGHRRGARRGRRDRAAGAARRPLRLHPVLAGRQRRQVADHAVPAERDVDPRRSTGPRRRSRTAPAWRSGRGTTRSRSWAPRAT